MGDEDRSIRSLPRIDTSSPQISPAFLRINDQQDIRERDSRPRLTYEQIDKSCPSQPSHRSAPGISYYHESGPSSSGSRFRPPRTDFTFPSSHQIAPPPLAPYVTADKRYHAPRPPSRQWLGPDGRRPETQDRPIFPPPPKPPPPHIVASASNFNQSGSSHKRDPSRLPPLPNRSYSHSPEPSTFQTQPLPDRPSTHTSQFSEFLPPQSPFRSHGGHRNDHHSQHRFPPIHAFSDTTSRQPYHGQPLGRTHSHESHGDHHSYAMHRDHSGESSISGSSQTGTSSMQSGQSYPMGGYKKKRTRALMTNMQQSGLTRLWRKTKFPTGADREKLGQEIGLTSRQVQVWFQNQRQKGRKALMVNGGIPEGEDPADYEDLQKSPRSRRLSIDGDERISAWAGSSASSASTRLLLDPPSSAGSNYHEPMSSVHYPHHSSHSYREQIPPRSVDPLRSPSPYERWEHERGIIRGTSGKYEDQEHSHRHHHHTHSRSHSQSQSYTHSYHGSSRAITHPFRSPSSLHHQQDSSSSSGHLHSHSSKWDRPFPSVLEPITRSPHPPISLSAPLPPTLSPLSTSSSSRPDTQQSQAWIPLPIKRRRSSPSIIPEAIKLAYPGNIEPSKANEERMRFSRSRSHSGEEYHPSDLSPDFPLTQSPIQSHLPPELARIALSGPVEKRYRQEERQEGLNLPGISPRSPDTPNSNRHEAGNTSIVSERSRESFVLERDKEISPRIIGVSNETANTTPIRDTIEERREDMDKEMERRESKKPIQSNLRSLLD